MTSMKTINDDIPKEVKLVMESAGAMFARDNKENPRKKPSSSNVRYSSVSFHNSQSSTSSDSPDIETVIKEFQRELDTLSRGFDLIASTQSISKTAKTGNDYYPLSARKLGHTLTDPDSTYLFQSSAISDKGDDGNSNIRKSLTHAIPTTPSDPPQPVNTPLASRVATTNRNNSCERQYFNGTGENEQNYKKIEDENRRLKGKIINLSHQLVLSKKIKDENCRLKEKIIKLSRQLVSKNESEEQDSSYNNTRTHNDKQQQQRGKSHMGLNINGFDRLQIHEQTQRDEHYYDETRPTPSAFSTFRSTRLSTQPLDEDKFAVEAANKVDMTYPDFTPGTKFVMELAKLMTLDQGKSVPLSQIIDEHWDKLKFCMREDVDNDH